MRNHLLIHKKTSEMIMVARRASQLFGVQATMMSSCATGSSLRRLQDAIGAAMPAGRTWWTASGVCPCCGTSGIQFMITDLQTMHTVSTEKLAKHVVAAMLVYILVAALAAAAVARSRA